jgi:hypothetical protein
MTALLALRPRHVAAAVLLLLISGGVALPATGQIVHGEVAAVDGQTLRVELDDSLTVDPGTSGRVVQQQTVNDEIVQMTFAVVTVSEMERPVGGAWIAVCNITRRSEDLQVGDNVQFDNVRTRSRLTVQSSPGGAMVYVDDEQAGRTPLDVSIGVGAHELRLEREGYQTARRSLTIDPEERRRINFNLQSAFGTLVVNSLPRGATVRLDGEERGQTPFSTEVQAGEYRLELVQDGYLTAERTVTVPGDGQERINVSLRRPLQVELAENQDNEIANTQMNREGDRLVVEYDLVGNKDGYTIELLLSTDGGETYEPLPEAVAGDAGSGIAPGRDKQLVWAAVEDYPEGITGEANRLRLDARPQGGGGLLWVLGGALAAGAGTTAAALLGVFDGGNGGGGGPPDLPDAPPAPPN